MFFVTSDLHYGLHAAGDRATRALAQNLGQAANVADVLCIAGDIATDDAHVRECLQLFRDFPGTKLAIAGNHDIWVSPGESSWTRYARLSRIFREEGFHPLEDAPIVIGGTAVVGTMGWYDYSFSTQPDISPDSFARKTFPGEPGPLWSDAVRANWGKTDAEMTSYFLGRLQRQLDEVSSATRVIAITHHLPHPALVPFRSWRIFMPQRIRFAQAFFGSAAFGNILARNPRVTHCVCGHSHVASSSRDHGCDFRSVGSDYHRKGVIEISGASINSRSFSGH